MPAEYELSFFQNAMSDWNGLGKTGKMDEEKKKEKKEESGPIRILSMRPEDLDAVAMLEKEIFTQPWSRDGFAASLEQSYTIYLCAWVGDQLSGYCGIQCMDQEGEITNVAVRPSMRGHGVAFQMMKELIRLAGERGVRQFFLEVRAGNLPAIGLYRKLGFTEAGIRRGFYERPKEDARVMVLHSLDGLPL